MMEDKNDNLLLEQFFSQAKKQEIADGGFSDRVMRQLPDRSLRLSRLWTAFCVLTALALFVVLRVWQPLLASFISLLQPMIAGLDMRPVPIFVSLGVLSCLMLTELAGRLELGR